MDIDAYLDRIGAKRPATVDGPALAELHERHLATVPFENLDIHLGVPIELDEDRLVAKVIGGRGGFCYELNGAFAALLRALGAEVTLLSAGVYGPSRARARRSTTWCCGSTSTSRGWPTSASAGTASTRCGCPSAATRPTRAARSGWSTPAAATWTCCATGPRSTGWRRGRAGWPTIAPTCWWQQTWPSSHFRAGPVASLQTAGGQVTVAGRTLIRTVGTDRTETALGSDAEVLAAYREHLGIELDRAP